jgi:serine/threonine protein kinase
MYNVNPGGSEPMSGEPGGRPDLLFGVIAVELGFISSDALRAALREQEVFPDPAMRPMLGQILVDRKLITPSQLVRILQTQRKRRDLPPQEVAPAHVSLNLTPGTFLARHRVVRELGDGPTGVLFEAAREPDGTRTALRVLRPGLVAEGAIELLQWETRVVGRLRHSSVVRLLEAGVHDELPYVACEFVEGTRLDRLLDRGELAPRALVEHLAWVARGLDEAHQVGVVHGGVRTRAVLLESDRGPRLTDFGLFRLFPDPAAQGGAAVAYAAPEQAVGGSAAAGPATDVFSLGVVLYESLTGLLPFTGSTPAEVLQKVVDEDPVPPRRLDPQVDERLETICRRALEKDPRDRYASAAAMADDLERYVRDERVARPSKLGKLWRRMRPGS